MASAPNDGTHRLLTDTTPSTLGIEARKLARNSLVYLLPNVLASGISVLLIPLYARAMGPGDLAIVSIANSIIAVLGIVLGLALYGCIPRLYFEYDKQGSRAFFGTLLTASLLFATMAGTVLWILGTRGYLDVFENVRFDPHLELVLLTSFANVFRPLVVTVYISREEPAKASALSLLAVVLQVAFTALFLVGLGQGAVGVLRANLAAGLITAGLSIVLMARLSTFDFRLPGLWSALAFSLPVVPHLIANWALAISDRLVLDRYVPAADLGRYSLAYVFGLMIGLVASSIVNALSPMANRQLKSEELTKNVPPLGTYTLFVVVTFALVVALTAPEAVALIATPAYAGAVSIVPWMVLGAIFQAIYFVWSIGTWFSMKTRLVPLVTAASAATNIVINLIFVPRYGVMAAAVSTAVAYAVLASLHGVLAQKLHPISWEYRRWLWLLGLALVWYVVGMFLGSGLPILDVAVKLVVAMVLYPASLAAVGFFTRSEIAWLGRFTARRLGRA